MKAPLGISLRWLARFFAIGIILGVATTSLGLGAQIQQWECPDCYRCDGGCELGTNEYGFDDCEELPEGGCGPNGGSPCCIPG